MTPRVIYGEDAILRMPELVAAVPARRVLLVCGRRSFEASRASRILTRLQEFAEVQRWSEFRVNTDAADLIRGLALVRSFSPDLVLGIGGGSAMDMAKLLCAYGGTLDHDDLLAAIRSGDSISRRRPRLFLAPTTSGSGSEATHFAVAYIGEEKFSVGGPSLRPDVVVLDPRLSISGSRSQRASSGIDAVCHAIESLWAIGATTVSRRYARRALGCLLPHIGQFVDEPRSKAARAMAIGSHLAGRAIDISMTTAAHALSYAITKRYGVSHGHAVALTLGSFIEAHVGADLGALHPDASPTEHERAMTEILRRLGAVHETEGRDRWLALMERLGLSTRLSDVGVQALDELDELAFAVNVERLENNPVLLDRDRLVGILQRAA